MINKTISVIGLGYIGLPTAAIFAAQKTKVIGIDINQHTVDTINQGRIHIVEPGLDSIVHTAVTAGYLRASTQPEPADAFLIAVPTPFKEDYKPDLSYIQAAAKSIANVLKRGDLIILESTSPVGTTEKMAEWLKQWREDLKFANAKSEDCDVYIAYCPERILPGQVIRELVENDRLIGGINNISTQKAKDIYKIFVKGELIPTNVRTAEMAKLTENAYRDVNIAFANELSLICDKLDINVWELIRVANHHPRVNILQPGPGVGGHCIAVDPWFIVHSAFEQTRLIRSAREINDSKPFWVIQQVNQAIENLNQQGMSKKDIKITCLGLAFKPDIDDLRGSPALDITLGLAQLYPGQILAVEPNIEHVPTQIHASAIPLVTLETAIAKSHILVFLVAHKDFNQSTNIQSERPINQLIIDTVGAYNRQPCRLVSTNKSKTQHNLPLPKITLPETLSHEH